MSTPTINPLNQRYPFELKNQPPEVVQAHRYSFQGILDLNQAIAAMKAKFDSLTTVVTTISTTSGSVTPPTPAPPFPFPGLGGVNDQTGVTSYTVTYTDNGILLILNDASPIAVSLDSALGTPYFLFVSNFGSGVATLTPTTGTINGSASFALTRNDLSIIVFDGTNWHASAVNGNNPYVAVTSTYAILTTDYQIECTANTFTVTLPTAVGVTGQVYSIKNSGTGIITVATTSSQTIDGSTTQTLNQWDNMQVMSNGSGWIII